MIGRCDGWMGLMRGREWTRFLRYVGSLMSFQGTSIGEMTMRRMLLTLSAVFALVALAAPADAQFKFGAQGAVITSVDDLGTFVSGAAKLSGTFGLGARTAFQPPALPIGVVAQGVYYFTDAADYDYLGSKG